MVTGLIHFAFTCAIAGVHFLIESFIRSKYGAEGFFAFAFTIWLGMLAGPGGREFAEYVIGLYPSAPEEIYAGIQINPLHK
jgi:hypothetical protein